MYAGGVKAPSVVFAALLLAGCYSPQLGSPGFFCHATDNPACPDGQHCVNGRCMSGVGSGSHNGGNTQDDMGGGNQSNPDFSTGNHSNPDFSTGSKPDLSQGNTSGKTGCLGELMCQNNCTTQTCADGCASNATPQGNSLFQALVSCVQTACPSDPGGPCDGTDSTGCDSCLNSAQSAGGQCASAQMACAASTP